MLYKIVVFRCFCFLALNSKSNSNILASDVTSIEEEATDYSIIYNNAFFISSGGEANEQSYICDDTLESKNDNEMTTDSSHDLDYDINHIDTIKMILDSDIPPNVCNKKYDNMLNNIYAEETDDDIKLVLIDNPISLSYHLNDHTSYTNSLKAKSVFHDTEILPGNSMVTNISEVIVAEVDLLSICDKSRQTIIHVSNLDFNCEFTNPETVRKCHLNQELKKENSVNKNTKKSVTKKIKKGKIEKSLYRKTCVTLDILKNEENIVSLKPFGVNQSPLPLSQGKRKMLRNTSNKLISEKQRSTLTCLSDQLKKIRKVKFEEFSLSYKITVDSVKKRESRQKEIQFKRSPANEDTSELIFIYKFVEFQGEFIDLSFAKKVFACTTIFCEQVYLKIQNVLHDLLASINKSRMEIECENVTLEMLISQLKKNRNDFIEFPSLIYHFETLRGKKIHLFIEKHQKFFAKFVKIMKTYKKIFFEYFELIQANKLEIYEITKGESFVNLYRFGNGQKALYSQFCESKIDAQCYIYVMIEMMNKEDLIADQSIVIYSFYFFEFILKIKDLYEQNEIQKFDYEKMRLLIAKNTQIYLWNYENAQVVKYGLLHFNYYEHRVKGRNLYLSSIFTTMFSVLVPKKWITIKCLHFKEKFLTKLNEDDFYKRLNIKFTGRNDLNFPFIFEMFENYSEIMKQFEDESEQSTKIKNLNSFILSSRTVTLT